MGLQPIIRYPSRGQAPEIFAMRLNNTPGRLVRSVEESSFDIWLKNKQDGAFWNTVWVDPHIKGEIICWLIDLEIRHRTHNRKNFIDFFNLLYQRLYTDAKPTSYYLKGRGYTTQDVLQALQDTTHSNWDQFYRTNIALPGDIDYAHFLSYAGLRLVKEQKKPLVIYKIVEANDSQ